MSTIAIKNNVVLKNNEKNAATIADRLKKYFLENANTFVAAEQVVFGNPYNLKTLAKTK